MSEAKIYVPADDAWDFFEDNRSELKKQMVELASCDDTTIYITEETGNPKLVVEIFGKEAETKTALSSFELLAWTEKLYGDYILFPTDACGDEDLDVYDNEESKVIDDAIIRDDELVCAMDDFLTVALDSDTYNTMCGGLGYEMQRLVLSDICEMLETNYGISVYWPTVDDWEPMPVDEYLGGA